MRVASRREVEYGNRIRRTSGVGDKADKDEWEQRVGREEWVLCRRIQELACCELISCDTIIFFWRSLTSYICTNSPMIFNASLDGGC